MNLNNYILAGEYTESNSRNLRHLRIRNQLYQNRYLMLIAREAGAFREILFASLAKGARAVRQIAVPAVIIQCVMLSVTLCYFFYPASKTFFQGIVELRHAIGPSFAFLSMGFIAIFAESLRRLSSGDWTRFGSSALFGFFVLGLLGIATDSFYILQNAMWGGLPPANQIFAKVLTDQFVWTVLIANPFQTFTYVFKDTGYNREQFIKRIRPFKFFYVREMLAVLITNWAFWIPVTAVVYSLPLDIQFVISRLAIIIWVLLLISMTNRD